MGAEQMGGARRSQGSRTRHAPPQSGSARLTARGAIAILFGVSLVGVIIATWFDQPWACGLVFVIGCLVASLWVRPSDTYLLVVAPPLVYFLALLIVEAFDGITSGKFLQVAAIGVVLNLSSVLFWLLGGTLLAIVILWIRGLPAAWRDFLAELRGGDEDEDAPYDAPAPDYGRQQQPMPRRPAPGYPSQPYADQRPRRPAPAQMPPRYAPPPQQPPRGYPPPRPGYPPQPGGYR
jgi:hypothetical protein